MRRIAALCLATTAIAGCAGEGEPAATAPRFETVVQDDALMLHVAPEETRHWLRGMKASGVDRVRITAGWGVLAPHPASRRRPGFDAADPVAYRGASIEHLDRAIQAIVDAGLRPMVDVAFWAPVWAVERTTGRLDGARWKPRPREFALFALAMARRYSGRFRGLPAVRLWTTWNEPNHGGFLLPQWQRRGGRWLPASPHHYRLMHEHAYSAITSVSARNRVLIGGLSSGGVSSPSTTRTMAPLLFLRELACVDRALRPLRRPECRSFRPLRGDGFAHHPYDLHHPPGVSRGGDRAGTGDLPRLSALLRELHRRGRFARRQELYITEYGYETDPPDPERGVSLRAQAAYLSQATAIVLGRPDVRMHAQFLWRDLPEDHLYQTGLHLPDGTPKPALRAFRLAFWVDDGVAVGQVSPGMGRQRVAIERRDPAGRWSTAVAPFATDRDGIYRRRLPGPGLYRLRWRSERSLPARSR